MFSIILRRILEAIPTLLIIAILTFVMLHLAPGGPFDDEVTRPAEIEKAINAHYHLDAPLSTQLWEYLKRLVQGDLGPSLRYPGYSVKEIILEKLPISTELAIYAFSLSLLLGITLGSLAAIKANSWLDTSATAFSTLGVCLPNFVIAPLLILFFSIYLRWLPPSGWETPWDRILPTITLALYYTAFIARLTRASMLEVLTQPYIITAAAKGLPARSIVFRHALKNGISPVISYIPPAFSGLITGSFVIETVFNIPGLGQFFILSAKNRDYTLLLGVILTFSTAIILLGMVSDIILASINPKVRIR